jgi:phosphoglycolate phosphatase
MPLNKPELVLMDLDGTLVDTAPDLTYCVNRMLQTLGLPVRGENMVRQWVGNGIERLVKRALTGDLMEEPDPEIFNQAYPLFVEIYTENTCNYSRLYDGVEEGLAYLESNNVLTGCVTNKLMCFTRTVLDKLGLHDQFGIVLAGDSLPRKKPDPLPLLHAADFFSVHPENSLMIGDSKNDIVAARAAGFRSLGVTYGYNQGEDIHTSCPDAVVDSLADIHRVFN